MAIAKARPSASFNKGPRPITMDRLQKKKAITRTLLIPATDEDSALLSEADATYQRALLMDVDVEKAKASLKAARDKVREDGLEFVFKGMGRKPFEELQRAHPPTEEQAKEHEDLSWNPETFLPALLAATVVNSELTPEQWDKDVLDSPEWGQAECGLILQTALAVNRENRVANLGN